jgi:hypothetical protein
MIAIQWNSFKIIYFTSVVVHLKNIYTSKSLKDYSREKKI